MQRGIKKIINMFHLHSILIPFNFPRLLVEPVIKETDKRRSRISEEKVIAILSELGCDMKTDEVSQCHGISQNTF